MINETQFKERLAKARREHIQRILSASDPVVIHRSQGAIEVLDKATKWLEEDTQLPRVANKKF